MEVLKFLNGNYDVILKELEGKMNTASENLEFERAIEYRELINSVKKIAQKQRSTDSSGRQRYSGGSFGRGRCGCSKCFYKEDG